MGSMILGRACAVAAGLFLASAASATVNIATVPVGNAGNASDPRTDRGRVDYDYRIGKYEVTAGQYTAFLNSAGGVDTYALYNTDMARTDYGSGISRSGTGTQADPFHYMVASDFVDRPVNYVSFWDACRFANWLQNGQPTGAQGEGTTETGAYTLTAEGMANNTILRNVGATWAVTSEDEWYKAAYHKNDGATGDYYLYPTGSDTAPGQDLADLTGNNANYYTALSGHPIDNGHYTTVAGEFQNSDSSYGTFDQGGNIMEWNEASFFGGARGLRGGCFDSGDILRADVRDYYGTRTYESRSVGFRVVQIPEPASMALLAFTGAGLLLRRHRIGR